MGGGPRDVAEHFMELHSSRILADDSRNRHHSPRKDYLQSELKVEDVITYLERLRERAERVAPPSRRTQETQTVPAALLPVTSTFLLQELPSSPAPQHLHQVRGTEHSRSVVRRSPSVTLNRYIRVGATHFHHFKCDCKVDECRLQSRFVLNISNHYKLFIRPRAPRTIMIIVC